MFTSLTVQCNLRCLLPLFNNVMRSVHSHYWTTRSAYFFYWISQKLLCLLNSAPVSVHFFCSFDSVVIIVYFTLLDSAPISVYFPCWTIIMIVFVQCINYNSTYILIIWIINHYKFIQLIYNNLFCVLCSAEMTIKFMQKQKYIFKNNQSLSTTLHVCACFTTV